MIGDRVKVFGPIAWLNTPTVDDRLIEELVVERRPLPLLGMLATHSFKADRGHFGAALVGEIRMVTFLDDGSVWMYAWMDPELAPVEGEEFGVGIDMDLATSITHHYNGEPISNDDLRDAYAEGHRLDIIDHMKGRLMGVTVYFNGATGAFPQARIRRVEDGDRLPWQKMLDGDGQELKVVRQHILGEEWNRVIPQAP
jgi:hypothetical protein